MELTPQDKMNFITKCFGKLEFTLHRSHTGQELLNTYHYTKFWDLATLEGLMAFEQLQDVQFFVTFKDRNIYSLQEDNIRVSIVPVEADTPSAAIEKLWNKMQNTSPILRQDSAFNHLFIWQCGLWELADDAMMKRFNAHPYKLLTP
jgi:hypothetical protein